MGFMITPVVDNDDVGALFDQVSLGLLANHSAFPKPHFS